MHFLVKDHFAQSADTRSQEGFGKRTVHEQNQNLLGFNVIEGKLDEFSDSRHLETGSVGFMLRMASDNETNLHNFVGFYYACLWSQ